MPPPTWRSTRISTEILGRHCRRDPWETCDPAVELGEAAAFVACDRAAAMTGIVANLTGGEIVDCLTYRG